MASSLSFISSSVTSAVASVMGGTNNNNTNGSERRRGGGGGGGSGAGNGVERSGSGRFSHAASNGSGVSIEEEDTRRERVLWCGFGELEAEGIEGGNGGIGRAGNEPVSLSTTKVLMLAYEDGFQVWSCDYECAVQAAGGGVAGGGAVGGGGAHGTDAAGDGRGSPNVGDVREIVSRRDGSAVKKVCCLPVPRSHDDDGAGGSGTMWTARAGPLRGCRPAVAVLCEENRVSGRRRRRRRISRSGSGERDAFLSPASEGGAYFHRDDDDDDDVDGVIDEDDNDNDDADDDGIEFGQFDSDSKKTSVVRIYSLQSHAYVHALHFKSKAGDVLASRRLLLVTLPGRLEAFAADSFDRVFTVMAYESVLGPNYTVAALGPRWLAYSAADAPPNAAAAAAGNALHQRLSKGADTRGGGTDSGKTGMHVDLDMVATQAANVAEFAAAGGKEVISRVRSLSESGYRALSGYLFGSSSDASGGGGGVPSPGGGGAGRERTRSLPPGSDRSSHADSGCGVILVRDVVTGTQVAHFRAHDSPLAKLAFSSAGTLLTSASDTGNNINVFRIIPGCAPSYQHIYKLHRGLTNATIRDISFTKDDKWLAASTGRGTAHVFAILDNGGVISPETHCVTGPQAIPIGSEGHDDASSSSASASSSSALSSSSSTSSSSAAATMPALRCTVAPSTDVVTTLKYTSLARLKSLDPWTDTAVQVSSAAFVATGISATASGAAAATFVPVHARDKDSRTISGGGGGGGAMDDVLVFSPSGSLTRYKLSTSVEKSKASVAVPDQLAVHVQPADRWDVRRRMGWPERQEDLEDVLGERFGDTAPLSPKASAMGGDAAMNDAKGLPWSAHAELLVHRPVVKPLWVSSQFHFHVMRSSAQSPSTPMNAILSSTPLTPPSTTLLESASTPGVAAAPVPSSTTSLGLGLDLGSMSGGGVEKIPSRRVEVRRVSARGLIPVCDTDGRLDEPPSRSTTLVPPGPGMNNEASALLFPATSDPAPVPSAAAATATPPSVVERDEGVGLSTVAEEDDAEATAADDNEKRTDDDLLDLTESSAPEPVRGEDAGGIEDDVGVSHEAEEAWGLDTWDIFSSNNNNGDSNAASGGDGIAEENDWAASPTPNELFEDVTASPFASSSSLSRDKTKSSSTTTLPPLVDKNAKASPVRLSKSKGKLGRRTGVKATSKRQVTPPQLTPPELHSDRNDDNSGGDVGSSKSAPTSASYSKSIFSLLEGLDVTSA